MGALPGGASRMREARGDASTIAGAGLPPAVHVARDRRARAGGRAGGYLLPCVCQYIRVRLPESMGFTCCAPIAELTPPVRSTPPNSTLTALPLTGRSAVTGLGGRPPPVKMFERDPPQIPAVPTAPEALRRFTA